MTHISQLTEHIWLMHAERKTDRPILAAIVGERRTLLLDAGNSGAHAAQFREELRKRDVRLPDLLVLTHWHWDHTFGMSEWNLPAIAHRKTAEKLQELAAAGGNWSDAALEQLIEKGLASKKTMQHIQEEYGGTRSIQVVGPDILFEEGMTLDLGGRTCEVRHVGGDHAEDSCYVYVKEEQVLFLGDALGPSVFGGPRKYEAGSFLRLLQLVREYEEAALVVESHNEPLTKEGFEADIRPWERMAELVQAHAPDRARIEAELEAELGVPKLPDELAMALEWFLTP